MGWFNFGSWRRNGQSGDTTADKSKSQSSMEEQKEETATAEATEEQPQAESENQQDQEATAPEHAEATAETATEETKEEPAVEETNPEETQDQPTEDSAQGEASPDQQGDAQPAAEEQPAEEPKAEETPAEEVTPQERGAEQPTQEGVREQQDVAEPQGAQLIQVTRAATKKLVAELNYDKVKELFDAKGYAFFDDGDYNLNIGGIRCLTDTNDFDDLVFAAYKVGGNKMVKVWQATTDAGSYWLNNPMNQEGCAILVPGQYRGSHAVGIHRGQYSALTQVKPVKVYRDDDRDNEHDMESSTIENGVYGINIHRSNPYTASQQVDKWSAGCQVFKQLADFAELMRICTHAKARYGNSFTYTLLNIEDFQ